MKYPEFIKKNDTIATTAISAGVTEKEKCLRFDNAKKQLEEFGFNVKETNNVRKDYKNRSDTALNRKKEFMTLWEDETVTAIIFARGGDFAMEVLEILDLEYIQRSKIKWIQGYSDITTISFVFTTMLEIATIYSANFGAFGMKPLDSSLITNLNILQGEANIQYSLEKYEKNELKNATNPLAPYNLDTLSVWKSIDNERAINIEGRLIGGCLDVILNLVGTKFDNVINFVEKYKNDGIIWFFEIYNSDTVSLQIALWQLKNAGYFKNCKGIIFGRSLVLNEYFDITFEEALKDSLKDLDVPIIYNADIGHIPPQLTIINGSITNVQYNDGKAKLTTKFL